MAWDWVSFFVGFIVGVLITILAIGLYIKYTIDKFMKKFGGLGLLMPGLLGKKK